MQSTASCDTIRLLRQVALQGVHDAGQQQAHMHARVHINRAGDRTWADTHDALHAGQPREAHRARDGHSVRVDRCCMHANMQYMQYSTSMHAWCVAHELCKRRTCDALLLGNHAVRRANAVHAGPLNLQQQELNQCSNRH